MKKEKIHKAFGQYSKEKLFAILFEEIPQVISINVSGEEIEDQDFLNLFNTFKKQFPEFLTYENRDLEKLYNFTCILGEKKITLDVGRWRASIFFKDDNDQSFIKKLKDFFSPYYKTKTDEAAYVSLIIKEPHGGFNTRKFKIKKVEFDLECHYNDDFMKEDRRINEFLSHETKSGLVLLHGVPGTGKTYYMRHLIYNNKDKNIIYLPNHLMSNLAAPEFINFMGGLESNTILLIEDAEEILKPRTEGNSNGAISNLLNMTDGILGDCFAIKIFASFNSSLDKIDSALLRKGRLVSKYEFKALSAEKTEALINKLNLKNIQTGSNKCMTLSEIYNNDSEDYNTTEKKTKPGFHLRIENELTEADEDIAEEPQLITK